MHSDKHQTPAKVGRAICDGRHPGLGTPIASSQKAVRQGPRTRAASPWPRPRTALHGLVRREHSGKDTSTRAPRLYSTGRTTAAPESVVLARERAVARLRIPGPGKSAAGSPGIQLRGRARPRGRHTAGRPDPRLAPSPGTGAALPPGPASPGVTPATLPASATGAQHPRSLRQGLLRSHTCLALGGQRAGAMGRRGHGSQAARTRRMHVHPPCVAPSSSPERPGQ